MKLDRILVPVDFSECSLHALCFALWLADNHGIPVTVANMVVPATGDIDVPVVSAVETQKRIEFAKDALESFVETAMAALGNKYEAKNELQIDTDIRVGFAAQEIVNSSRENGAHLIVMGTRGEHNRLDAMFGSVTTNVLRRAEVPVLVVPENEMKLDISRACYATDLDSSDALHIWRTHKLLAPFNPKFFVVHVHKSDEKTEVTMQDLEEFLESGDKVDADFYSMFEDDVDDSLEDFIEDNDISLLALHSPKKTLFERLMRSSLSRKLALDLEIPMLVLK